MQPYIHFTLAEREYLVQLLREGKSKSETARILNRSRSSIYRELERNKNQKTGYNPWHACSLYIFRRKRCIRPMRIVVDQEMKAFISEKISIFWPPETIAAIWNREHPHEKFSHTTIYRALRRGLIEGYGVKTHLRRRGKRRYKNRGKYNTIKPDYTIHDRPAIAASRQRIGDWEGDTIVSGAKGKGCLFTCVDRASRFLVIARCESQDAATVCDGARRALQGLPVHSLTLDNGSEFAQHRKLAESLGTKIYFADPRSPWQRPTNEQTNDVIRFFFPNPTDFSTLHDDNIALVEDLINDRPRKCLDWLSPKQVFLARCCT